jgi:catechol 2,3-dioxygenase-like lactoylglutathione lyase family enzyme
MRTAIRSASLSPSSAARLVAGVCSPDGALYSGVVTAARPTPFLGIDHVQLAAPAGCEADARRFFGDLLGLPELPKPAAMAVRGGLWFVCGAQQIHIGIERDFRPAKKAHPALRLIDEAALHTLKSRLDAAGIATREDREIEDAARFFADDPWGNRLEFVAARTS